MKKKLHIPNHIAIIPDGNRRYAKARGMSPWEGHRAGAKTFKKTVDWCIKAGIKEFSFWTCSTENLLREKKEVNFLLKLFENFTDEFMRTIKKDNSSKLKIRFIGAIDRLPKKLADKLKAVEINTKNNKGLKINFMVAYGGEWEITRATMLIAKEVLEKKLSLNEITPAVFEKHLSLDSKPDLIIRTSQERLSGFLPWQSAYSEIIFLKNKYWPEFSKKDFDFCLEEYSKRIRTYGK
jgi:undecaprenyl diphosphate synthase